jgi:hypothetical protein
LDDPLLCNEKLSILFRVSFEIGFEIQNSFSDNIGYRTQSLHTCKEGCPSHYTIDDPNLYRAKLIQYKFENLSIKTLQMEEAGKINLKNMSGTYNLSLG